MGAITLQDGSKAYSGSNMFHQFLILVNHVFFFLSPHHIYLKLWLNSSLPKEKKKICFSVYPSKKLFMINESCSTTMQGCRRSGILKKQDGLRNCNSSPVPNCSTWVGCFTAGRMQVWRIVPLCSCASVAFRIAQNLKVAISNITKRLLHYL